MFASEQLQQYEYYQRLRRRSMYKYSAKLQKIQQIRQFIISGGAIETSPYYEDYLKLVDESGGAYFIFDDNVGKNVNMTKENGEV